MKLFDNYLNTIDAILQKRETRYFSSAANSLPTYFEKSLMYEGIEAITYNEDNKVLIEFDENELEKLYGRNPSTLDKFVIGTHPDFADIQHFQFENHYCVTMFMDIVGSTRLNEKYSLPEIRKIKDTILTLAIKVSYFFGGHIHRLQGDGIMIQFVRRGLKEANAVINALNASSILTNFISNDLAQHFEQNGIKPLRVRVGIDLGFKDDVIWSHYGLVGCSELTTTSLHTDLAAKLQSQSKSNGIYIGGNIKNVLDLDSIFCEDIKDENQTTDYYIYQGFKNYRKYNFNWHKYLKTYDFIKENNGKLVVETPYYRLKCIVTKDQKSQEYFQNSNSMQKDTSIKYEIYENGLPYHKKSFETIEWKAVNSGQEAKNIGHEIHDFGGKYKNLTYCETSAAYKGHHYVECIIKREHSENKRLRFHIFVD